MNIVQIRASSLAELFDCAHRWESKYILGLRNPTSAQAHLGTSIHAGAALWDQAGIDGIRGDVVTEGDALEAFTASLKNPEFEVAWEDESADKLLPIGIDLLTKYMRGTSQQFTWEGVEIACEPLVLADLGLELTGTTDRIYRDSDGNYGIADLKTGKSAVGADGKSHASAYRAQLGCYELLVSMSLGVQITAPAVVIGLSTAKTPASRRVGASTTEGCTELLVGTTDTAGLLMLAARIIHSGVFYPNPGSPMCHPKYCPRYRLCAYRK